MLGKLLLSFSAASVLMLAQPSHAGVTVSTSPTASGYPPTPAEFNYSDLSQASVSQGLAPGGALTITFTPSASIQLDKFVIMGAGGNFDGVLNIYSNSSGGGPTDTFVNPNDGTPLLGGGAGVNFTFNGSAGSLIVFDLDGADEISLVAGMKYAIDLQAQAGETDTLFISRTPGLVSDFGHIYSTSDPSTFRGLVGGGNRQVPLGIYAVPEPGSIALLGLGGLAMLRRYRRC